MARTRRDRVSGDAVRCALPPPTEPTTTSSASEEETERDEAFERMSRIRAANKAYYKEIKAALQQQLGDQFVVIVNQEVAFHHKYKRQCLNFIQNGLNEEQRRGFYLVQIGHENVVRRMPMSLQYRASRHWHTTTSSAPAP